MNPHLLQRHALATQLTQRKIMKRSSSFWWHTDEYTEMNNFQMIQWNETNSLAEWIISFVYWRFLFVGLSAFFMSCYCIFCGIVVMLIHSIHLWTKFEDCVTSCEISCSRQPLILRFDHESITFILPDVDCIKKIFKLYAILSLSISLNFFLFVYLNYIQGTLNKYAPVIDGIKQIPSLSTTLWLLVKSFGSFSKCHLEFNLCGKLILSNSIMETWPSRLKMAFFIISIWCWEFHIASHLRITEQQNY